MKMSRRDIKGCAYYDKKPKQGEWILTDNMNYSPFDGSSPTVKTCSVCKFKYSDKRIFNFCPNCGADMRVKDELNRVSKELNSEIEYKAKVKELEDAIAKCEKAEKEFKSRTCKFRSPTNCDFCSFHSDCDEHWREGEAE